MEGVMEGNNHYNWMKLLRKRRVDDNSLFYYEMAELRNIHWNGRLHLG